MSRIHTPDLDNATGTTAELFGQIRKAVGSVPNTYAAIGFPGPAAFKAVLAADAVLAAGSLPKADQETIKLLVSSVAGCDYCVAAHSLLGKMAGLSPDVLRHIRAADHVRHRHLELSHRSIEVLPNGVVQGWKRLLDLDGEVASRKSGEGACHLTDHLFLLSSDPSSALIILLPFGCRLDAGLARLSLQPVLGDHGITEDAERSRDLSDLVLTIAHIAVGKQVAARQRQQRLRHLLQRPSDPLNGERRHRADDGGREHGPQTKSEDRLIHVSPRLIGERVRLRRDRASDLREGGVDYVSVRPARGGGD